MHHRKGYGKNDKDGSGITSNHRVEGKKVKVVKAERLEEAAIAAGVPQHWRDD